MINDRGPSCLLTLFLLCGMLFCTTMFITPLSAGGQSGDLLIVDGLGHGDNHSTITEAIIAAAEGDTIHVMPGLYIENLIVDKNVTIIGNGTDTIVEAADPSLPTINVTSDGVGLNSFKVTGSNSAGILLHGISDSNISGLSVTGNDGNGIVLLPGSSGITITDSNISDNGGDGVRLLESGNNTLMYNKVNGNGGNGIVAVNTVDPGSNDNVFARNNIIGNDAGICILEGSGNSVYNNNLIGNRVQAVDNGSNSWNLTYPGGGNYWDDHEGVDSDKDGYADEPRPINGSSAAKDNYPLMQAWFQDDEPPQAKASYGLSNLIVPAHGSQMVSTESSGGSWDPSIAVDALGNAHIVWADNTDYLGSGIDRDIFYKVRWANGTMGVTEIVSTDSSYTSDRPSLAIDSQGMIHVVYENHDGTRRHVAYNSKALDGGWGASETVSTESSHFEGSWNPQIALDGEDNVHVVWRDKIEDLGGTGSWNIYYKNKSGGASWSSTELVSSESTGVLSEDSSLAVEDDGTVHVVWNDRDTQLSYKFRWINGTWGETEEASPPEFSSKRYPSLALDDQGTPHIVWRGQIHIHTEPTNIFYNHRTEDGQWSDAILVSSESVNRSDRASAAFDRSGNLHVVWHDNTDFEGSGPDYDILYKVRWKDGVWSDTRLISIDADNHSWPRSYQKIDVDDNGVVHIVWDESEGEIRDETCRIVYTSFPLMGQGAGVIFNGSSSTDNVGIVNYTWRFSYGGADVELHGVSPQFTFDNADDHHVTLTVADAAGNHDEDTVTVIIADTVPPVADAGDDLIVGQGTAVNFDGTGSNDEVGGIGSGIVNYTWKFSYEDEPVELYGVSPQFTFNDVGNYSVLLIVMDAAEFSDSDVTWVNVTDSVPPKALAAYSVQKPLVTLDTTVVLTPDSDFDINHHSSTVDAHGIIHLVWEEHTDYGGSGDDRDIFYRFIDEDGTIGDIAVISLSGWHASEPKIVVDADGNLHVVWYEYVNYGSGWVREVFHRGKPSEGPWGGVELVSTDTASVSENPSIAVGTDGKVHVIWEDNSPYGGSGTDYDIFYRSRTTEGIWGSVEVVSSQSTHNSRYPSIAIDNDGVAHVAWHDQTNYAGSGTDWDIFYKYRADGAWSVTEVVSTESTAGSYIPTVKVDNLGSIHVVWQDQTNYDGSGTDLDIFYKYRADGAWSVTEVVSTESTLASSMAALQIDDDRNVHVVWRDLTDLDGSDRDADIFYKVMSSSGIWSGAAVVSTESTSTSTGPSISLAGGYTHVTWVDSTDIKGAEGDNDIFHKKISPLGQGIVVILDATQSHDNVTGAGSGIVNYTWSFNYGGEDVNIYGVLAGFTFNDVGNYKVILTVTDAEGFSGTDDLWIDVKDTVAPLAVTGPDKTILQGDNVLFNGSNSNDNVVGVGSGIVNYTWSFFYSGELVELYGAGPDFTFDDAGNFTVTLTVTDAVGLKCSDTMWVNVTDTTPPIADAGDDFTVYHGRSTTFDGGASTDNVGIENYTWTFTYVGEEIALYGAQPSFVFDDPGEYQVILRVTDAAGNWDEDTVTLTVIFAWYPEIESAPIVNGQETQTYTYMASANESVFWHFQSDAAFLNHEVLEGELKISGIPAIGEVGLYHVNISATSIEGKLTSWQNFTLSIQDAWAPELGPPPEDGQEAWFYEHVVTANESVSWEIIHNLPASLTITSNETSFTVEGDTELGDRGSYWINVTATSEAGKLSTTHNWTLDLGMAWAPTLGPAPPDARETFYYEHIITVNESIMGYIVHWSLPQSLVMDIDFDNATFTISGTPQAGDAGIYSMNFTVWSEAGKLEVFEEWELTILSAWAPELGPPPEDGQEAWFYEHEVTANESVSWDIAHNLPPSLTITSNETSFTVEGDTELGDRGSYWINVTATSEAGKLSTTHNWTLNFGAAWAPTLGPPPPDALEVVHYEHVITVNESIMGYIVHWSLPQSLVMDIDFDNATFTISGTPQAGDAGIYSMNFTVWSLEGKLHAYEEWNLTIHHTWAPEFISEPPPAPHGGFLDGQTYIYILELNETVDISMDTDAGFLVLLDEGVVIGNMEGGVYYVNITAHSPTGRLVSWQNYTLPVVSYVLVNGTVLDGEGDPVGGVGIWVGGVLMCNTDEDGCFEFSVREGDHSVLVTREGFEPKTIELSAHGSEPVSLEAMTLTAIPMGDSLDPVDDICMGVLVLIATGMLTVPVMLTKVSRGAAGRRPPR